MTTTNGIPDGLPVLSRGKHRNARKGACFMEMASVLADEPWSDRPRCTHPLLAQLARMVNDHTSDARRGELVPLIPLVIGVRGAGLGWELALTSAVACRAVYDVPEESQRALAAGLLRCAELADIAEHGDPVDRIGLEYVDREAIAQALASVPGATTWARGFIESAAPLRPKNFKRHAAPAVLVSAVRGTARAAVSDPDGRLRDLLTTGIDVARSAEGPRSMPVSPVSTPTAPWIRARSGALPRR